MISRGALTGALAARKVAEWVVVERAQELAMVDEARPLVRTEERTRWTLTVHHDTPAGRGTARIELGARDASADEVVAQAIELAAAATGRAWRSRPPAAPARVALLDERLAQVQLADLARELIDALPRPEGTSRVATLEVMREDTAVVASSGFQMRWPATLVRGQALVSLGQRSLDVARTARRIEDLALAPAITAATADLAQLAAAAPPRPGRCAVILGAEVLLHDGVHGLWSVFADHASAETERQGLARYRLRTTIAPGADQLAEPLSIASDGALSFGFLSAPISDEGAAIRHFPLIERGVAVGLGLSMREAARRNVDPNGGVRNLVVSPGTWTGEPPATRTLDVRRLRSLSIDPYTGFASLELALALDLEGAAQTPVTGGTLRLDLVAALARARRSATLVTRGAYRGPEAVLIDDVELLT